MRAGNDQRTLTANKIFSHDLRLRAVQKLAVQHFFQFQITARNSVADNRHIGPDVGVIRFITVEDLDAETGELSGHRRIDILIRAGDFVSA